MKKLLTALLVCASITAIAADQDGHEKGHDKAKQHGHEKAKSKAKHHAQHQAKSINISPKLRAVLNQEMQQIKGGMESLVFATVSGNWHKISSVGHQIKHSYIMKQKLTEKQRNELHQSLPMGFKQLDKKLHNYAGMLAHVAKEHDMELVNYYIYKMNETCASCHAQYASDKFPGFKAKNKHAGDDH
ncbi:MAG: hypothetical protein MJK04_32245 [Psychrosphaera sp.]|nr:hypothetical protein [Psychrosphaera sp.]